MLESNFKLILDQIPLEAIEWSMDQGWSEDFSTRYILPEHIQSLLEEFSRKDCLWGHGVHLSPGSAHNDELQFAWLQRFEEECQEFKFKAITEHFGFMRTSQMTRGAPLPLPPCSKTVEIISQNLARMKEISSVQIGIENLALSFSKEDSRGQAWIISKVLEEIDGCLVMDLHNLYCQCFNYGLDWRELIQKYPLDRVQIIHVSGGSIDKIGNREFRRDTHDGPIPEEVFQMLIQTLPMVENLEVVFFEYLGRCLVTEEEVQSHVQDYHRVFEIVQKFRQSKSISKFKFKDWDRIPEVELKLKEYEQYQIKLIDLLTSNIQNEKIQKQLIQIHPSLKPYVQSFDSVAIEITKKICLKWLKFKSMN